MQLCVHMVVRKVGRIVAWLIDSYTVVILDGQVLLVVLVTVPSSQATTPGVVFCPIVIMVGHHASPGTITDRPKVGVERVHAGGEAAEVLPVKLPSEALQKERVEVGDVIYIES